MDKLINGAKFVFVFVVIFLLLWQLWGFLPLIIGGKLFYDTSGLWALLNGVIAYLVTSRLRKPATKRIVENEKEQPPQTEKQVDGVEQEIARLRAKNKT